GLAGDVVGTLAGVLVHRLLLGREHDVLAVPLGRRGVAVVPLVPLVGGVDHLVRGFALLVVLVDLGRAEVPGLGGGRLVDGRARRDLGPETGCERQAGEKRECERADVLHRNGLPVEVPACRLRTRAEMATSVTHAPRASSTIAASTPRAIDPQSPQSLRRSRRQASRTARARRSVRLASPRSATSPAPGASSGAPEPGLLWAHIAYPFGRT